MRLPRRHARIWRKKWLTIYHFGQTRDFFAIFSFPRKKAGRPGDWQRGIVSGPTRYTLPLYRYRGIRCDPCSITWCVHLLQHSVTMRTMDDGSFEEMLEERNLADSLGSKESVRNVPPTKRICLSYRTPVSCYAAQTNFALSPCLGGSF